MLGGVAEKMTTFDDIWRSAIWKRENVVMIARRIVVRNDDIAVGNEDIVVRNDDIAVGYEDIAGRNEEITGGRCRAHWGGGYGWGVCLGGGRYGEG